MKIWKNLKWLFNHPPTGITQHDNENDVCDYCGRREGGLWICHGQYIICDHCRRKVFDKVLGKPDRGPVIKFDIKE